MEKLYSPTIGILKDIAECSDEVFAERILGDGVLVLPDDDKIVSPVDGTIDSIQGTLHAITIKSDGGNNILLHCGVDTVKLKGKGFKSFVNVGQHVNVGTLLVSMDKKIVTDAGYDPSIILIVADSKKNLKKNNLNERVTINDVIAEVEDKI